MAICTVYISVHDYCNNVSMRNFQIMQPVVMTRWAHSAHQKYAILHVDTSTIYIRKCKYLSIKVGVCVKSVKCAIGSQY